MPGSYGLVNDKQVVCTYGHKTTAGGNVRTEVQYETVDINSVSTSDSRTIRWINESSAICELLNTKAKVYDNALHRSSCLLLENHEEIEQRLSGTAREIFDLKETVILYDLTNTCFEIGSNIHLRSVLPANAGIQRIWDAAGFRLFVSLRPE